MSRSDMRARETAQRDSDVGAEGHGGLSPLAVILATMRSAHAESEAEAARAAGLTGKEAEESARRRSTSRELALDAAKAAAPYLHARLTAVADADATRQRHEDALAELDAKLREHDRQNAAAGN